VNDGRSLIRRIWDTAVDIRDKLTGESARRQGRTEAYSKYMQKYGREIRMLEAQIEQRSKDFLEGTKFGFAARGQQKNRTIKGKFSGKARFRIKRDEDSGDTKNDKW